MESQVKFNLSSSQLRDWVKKAKQKSKQGNLPRYIPQLAQVDAEAFAVCILSQANSIKIAGDATHHFPLMSVIKPFLLLYLLVEQGTETIFNRVGLEPSEYPYNSLDQLQADGGKPRNPMINSGAITLADLIAEKTAIARCETLRIWLNHWGNCQLFLDESVYQSVASLPNPNNQALTQTLLQSGQIQDAEIALETYNLICCLSGTVTDLAKLGMMLVQPPQLIGAQPGTIVKALMMTCGLYQASAQFAVKVGLPTKSGVSGAVLSVIPGQGAIASYSPPLDAQGNSIGGVYLIAEIAQALNLSVFI
ncbi:MAG: glutaminase A [Microcoleaceae cyanobacterium]